MDGAKFLPGVRGTVVEQSNTDPEIGGSNPTSAWHQEKVWGGTKRFKLDFKLR